MERMVGRQSRRSPGCLDDHRTNKRRRNPIGKIAGPHNIPSGGQERFGKPPTYGRRYPIGERVGVHGSAAIARLHPIDQRLRVTGRELSDVVQVVFDFDTEILDTATEIAVSRRHVIGGSVHHAAHRRNQ